MLKLKILSLAVVMLPSTLCGQQRFSTRNGTITFFSETPVENIEGTNHKVTSVFDATSGAMEFAALIKAFEFEKALMQEHFNENYMESNAYPKAIFKGKLTGLGEDEVAKPGTYEVTVTGDLTIHGVTKPITAPGTVVIDAGGVLKASSEFMIEPEDHGIKIPGVVRKNIAQKVKVTVQLDYNKM